MWASVAAVGVSRSHALMIPFDEGHCLDLVGRIDGDSRVMLSKWFEQSTFVLGFGGLSNLHCF